ncbi:HsdM family class I SAM-dependent methyltransferase [Corynebacterium callunae]|uniref:N-6 DNA methylase n=1 Tax=Corynebacterium callunae DSM 20147 TaxID=1121353 RepID=M1UDY1_9CORY|nr:N-6 DNA methylase [Corynebacterium callunae]AGG66210.1 N-6 DNA methylase [Corynebacterium callunae DSM 20147]
MATNVPSTHDQQVLEEIWSLLEGLGYNTRLVDCVVEALTLLTLRAAVEKTHPRTWEDIRQNPPSQQAKTTRLLVSTVLSRAEQYRIPEGKVISRRTFPPTIISALIAIISDPRLGQGPLAVVSFARAYEFLLDRVADCTPPDFLGPPPPRWVRELITGMLRPHQGVVYDPCARSGQLLTALDDYQQTTDTAERLVLCGQENDPVRWRQGHEQAVLRGTRIDLGSQPLDMFGSYLDDGNGPGGWWFRQEMHPGLECDFCVSYPPASFIDSGLEFVLTDPRWEFGPGMPDPADFAWLQLAYHHLRPGGTAAVMLSADTLFSDDWEMNRVRTNMISEGVVRCIIHLSSGNHPGGSHVPTALWVCSRPDNDMSSTVQGHGRDQQILLVDLSQAVSGVSDSRDVGSDRVLQKIISFYYHWGLNNSLPVPLDLTELAISISADKILDGGGKLIPSYWIGHQKGI